MQPGVFAKRFSDDQCAQLLAADAVKHGLDIAGCLPDELPVKTRAAFVSFAYNVGSGAFCKSTLSTKAKRGDLRGACAELSKWVYAGKKKLPGLVKRRQHEEALCFKGIVDQNVNQ